MRVIQVMEKAPDKVFRIYVSSLLKVYSWPSEYKVNKCLLIFLSLYVFSKSFLKSV